MLAVVERMEMSELKYPSCVSSLKLLLDGSNIEEIIDDESDDKESCEDADDDGIVVESNVDIFVLCFCFEQHNEHFRE